MGYTIQPHNRRKSLDSSGESKDKETNQQLTSTVRDKGERIESRIALLELSVSPWPFARQVSPGSEKPGGFLRFFGCGVSSTFSGGFGEALGSAPPGDISPPKMLPVQLFFLLR